MCCSVHGDRCGEPGLTVRVSYRPDGGGSSLLAEAGGRFQAQGLALDGESLRQSSVPQIGGRIPVTLLVACPLQGLHSRHTAAVEKKQETSPELSWHCGGAIG